MCGGVEDRGNVKCQGLKCDQAWSGWREWRQLFLECKEGEGEWCEMKLES